MSSDDYGEGTAHLDGKLWWTVVGAFVAVAMVVLMTGIAPPLDDDPGDDRVEPDCSKLIISDGENGSEMRTTEANIEACETKSGNLSLSGLNSSYRTVPVS